MLGQAVPQREKQMEEPISNKNECNGAWDFQRRFQVKPNYGSARNFRMRVPLPYCNSGIGYSVLMGEFKVQILHCTWSLCVYRCNICCIIYLIIASFVLLAKTKAPGVNLHNHLASIIWRFNYFANSILAPKHRGVVPYEHIHHTQRVRLFVVRFPPAYFTISQHYFTILHLILQKLIHNSRELGEKLYCPVVLGGSEKVCKGCAKGVQTAPPLHPLILFRNLYHYIGGDT